jgi:N-acetyl-gamma-glutamylphosphate reductase
MQTETRPRVGIVGATGYAGRELISLLTHHPALELAVIMG